MGNHSFASIESKDFHNLICYLHKDASVPSADTIKKEIMNIFKYNTEKIRQVLQVNKLYYLLKLFYFSLIIFGFNIGYIWKNILYIGCMNIFKLYTFFRYYCLLDFR